ncbi:hypothetical protein PT974_12224 [Cladobotryum mycophilum]|uniref:Uncharacterized protein n=1 Tax=Cladobotryum mycophilum TaxID=491253 RepID=A0ABR0S8I2_9HYPO
MALWLFRLKGSRKRSSSGAALSDPDNAPPPPRAMTEGIVKRTGSKRKQVAAPLPSPLPLPLPLAPPRRARTYSFSPDRRDSIRVDRRDQDEATNENAQPPASDRVPTLHHKRSSNHPMRRKSSKRRREDHNREAEIKAMTNFVPIRAATYAWTPTQPPKHIHKRVRTMGAEPAWEHPTSDLSLPLHSSINSTLSSESELVSYRVSALDALAPRPTLRYAASRILNSRASVPTRSGSQKRSLAGREPIPEETLKAHKRIDDLADGFDASELRELMERDARRRERQQQHEREKMERRLARKAEKQKLKEVEARQAGTPPPKTWNEVSWRDSPEPMSGVDEDSLKKSSEGSPKQPLEAFHPVDESTSVPEVRPSTEEQSQTVAEVAEHEEQIADLPTSSKLEGALRSKKSMSKSTLGSDKEKAGSANDDDATTRKDSVASSKTNRMSLMALLKWGMRNRRNSSDPSSFSNTSREEMQAAAAQARAQADDDSAPPTPTGNYLSKPGSGTPRRMHSRFREDLPELPLNAQLQPPEAQSPLPIVAEHKPPETASTALPPGGQDMPMAAHRSVEGLPPITTSVEKMFPVQPTEPHLSVSLASVDSEGSWLSGRMSSQRSTNREAARAKRRNQEQSAESPGGSTREDYAIAEDEYMARLSPEPPASGSNIHPSGEGRPSSDEDEVMKENDVKWGAVGAQPQFIQVHRQGRDTFHSRSGLLDIDSVDEEEVDTPVSPVSDDKVDLQHARSVPVGHARNYSAGSAKLLEITPSRLSVDDKGKSREKLNSSQVRL